MRTINSKHGRILLDDDTYQKVASYRIWVEKTNDVLTVCYDDKKGPGRKRRNLAAFVLGLRRRSRILFLNDNRLDLRRENLEHDKAKKARTFRAKKSGTLGNSENVRLEPEHSINEAAKRNAKHSQSEEPKHSTGESLNITGKQQEPTTRHTSQEGVLGAGLGSEDGLTMEDATTMAEHAYQKQKEQQRALNTHYKEQRAAANEELDENYRQAQQSIENSKSKAALLKEYIAQQLSVLSLRKDAVDAERQIAEQEEELIKVQARSVSGSGREIAQAMEERALAARDEKDAQLSLDKAEVAPGKDQLRRIVDATGPITGFFTCFALSVTNGYFGISSRFPMIPVPIQILAPIAITILCAFPIFYSKMEIGQAKLKPATKSFTMALLVIINIINLGFNIYGANREYMYALDAEKQFTDYDRIEAQIQQNQDFVNRFPATDKKGEPVRYKKEITQEYIASQQRINSLQDEYRRLKQDTAAAVSAGGLGAVGYFLILGWVLFCEAGMWLSIHYIVLVYGAHRDVVKQSKFNAKRLNSNAPDMQIAA